MSLLKWCLIITLFSVGPIACSKSRDEVPSPEVGMTQEQLDLFELKLDTLSEYKLYVAPLLARMKRSSPDHLYYYLDWAAHQKTWYFIEQPFGALPQTQSVTLAGQGSWSRQNRKSVFITSALYFKQSHKTRAFLLLREMILAARLISKLDPPTQCSLLGNPEVFGCQASEATEPATPPVDAQPIEIGNDDVQAAHAVAASLFEHHQDLSAFNLRSIRQRAGIYFPWDELSSLASHSDIVTALEKAASAGSQFRDNVIRNDLGEASHCLFALPPLSREISPEDPTEGIRDFHLYNADPARIGLAHEGLVEINWGERLFSFVPLTKQALTLDPNAMKGKGVINGISGFVDRITYLPVVDSDLVEELRANPDETLGPKSVVLALEIEVSREPNPKVIRIKTIPYRIIIDFVTDADPGYELVPASDVRGSVCELIE